MTTSTAPPPQAWTHVLPLTPMGKQRPRVARGRAYTPKKTEDWTIQASVCFRLAWGNAQPYVKTPLRVEIDAYFPRPKSRPKYIPFDVWKTGKSIPKVTTPDTDNIAKIVLDAMTKAGIFQDDALVVEQPTTKRLCSTEKGDVPRVVIRIQVLDWIEEAKRDEG